MRILNAVVVCLAVIFPSFTQQATSESVILSEDSIPWVVPLDQAALDAWAVDERNTTDDLESGATSLIDIWSKRGNVGILGCHPCEPGCPSGVYAYCIEDQLTTVNATPGLSPSVQACLDRYRGRPGAIAEVCFGILEKIEIPKFQPGIDPRIVLQRDIRPFNLTGIAPSLLGKDPRQIEPISAPGFQVIGLSDACTATILAGNIPPECQSGLQAILSQHSVSLP